MKRSEFIKLLALLPIAGIPMKLDALNTISENLESTTRMPVLFLGHGSPMNAIEDNEFVQGFRNIGKGIPKPKAIICFSAHWETKGTFVTAMQNPKTIHDFGGFPKELYDVQYSAKGNPELAEEIKKQVKKSEVGLDQSWGLDHGAWSVIKHLYPEANIPVLQLSIDYTKPPQYHYALSKELQSFRDKGVLIIGSGNMVHNLRKVAWDKMNQPNYAFDWAAEASDKMKKLILADSHQQLINYTSLGKSFELAIPTPEHYMPMIFALGQKKSNDEIKLFNDKAVGGSLTMTSFKIG
jgi:4,5-DOPA dioxygenase extradiol